MSRGSGGTLRYFFAVGGPANGELVGVKPGATRYSRSDPTHVQGVRYSYVLVDGPDGRKVFVPEDDQCLRTAFLGIFGNLNDREAAALVAEMRRRRFDM